VLDHGPDNPKRPALFRSAIYEVAKKDDASFAVLPDAIPAHISEPLEETLQLLRTAVNVPDEIYAIHVCVTCAGYSGPPVVPLVALNRRRRVIMGHLAKKNAMACRSMSGPHAGSQRA
jgi:hypothetical protein